MRIPIVALLGLVLSLAACDAVGSDPAGAVETGVSRSGPQASLVNGEVQLYIDRTASTTRNSIYLVSGSETIRCDTDNATTSGGTYHIVVYNEGADTGDGLRDCDGLLDYGTNYLIVTGGATNGIRFSLPTPGDGSGDFVASLSGSSWSIDNQTVSADPDLVGRSVSFTFPQGLYTTSEYDSAWTPRWTAQGGTYPLPFAVDVDADLQYRTASGSLATLNAFDGIGNSTSGSWSAQGGSSGTLSVTDELSNQTSSVGFTVQGGSGGGGPDKCFPGGVNWPACQA